MGASGQRSFISLLFVCLWLVGGLVAQTGGSQLQSGNHSIEIHVVNQTGAPLDTSLRVEVLSTSGLHMAEAYSNREEGVADFGGFSDGLFQVRITGPGIEPVTQTFQIAATEPTHREYVRVERKDTQSGSEASSTSDPTVSAQELAAPPRARAEFEKGMEAYAKGNSAAAQEALKRAIELYPGYVKAHNNLGVLYQNAGLVAKAVVEYSRAVELDPKFAPGYVNIAKLSIASGNLAEAEPQLKKALAVDPGAVSVLFLLCSTEFGRREYAEALATAHHVHETTAEPQYAEVHLISAKILIAQRRPREAASEYQMFIKERPSDPRSEKVKSLIAELSAQ